MTEALPLAGLSVAVTRPAGLHQSLLDHLRAAGAEATAIPLLAIVPVDDPEAASRVQALLRDLPHCQHAIFISQNAAEQAMLALQRQGQAWPRGVQAWAVGTATADYLAREHGITAQAPADRMNSEGLLALPGLQAVGGQRVVVFRGLGGRETLATTLRQRGASVAYAELYRRTLPAGAAGQWQHWLDALGDRPAVACLNSIETLKHLQAIDKAAATRDNLFLLVPGERVREAAARDGFTRLLVAPDALDTSILNHLLAWYRHNE